ncbi:MAG: DUF362 domain-containing protein [Oscillospiraceae bacterium]|nr:DUF362 domain-containing protein [Oscillospiraceae bacterium]
MKNITINYTDKITEGTIEMLTASNLKSLVNSTMAVALKPNMVNSRHPSEGSTTHAEVVEGIVIFLQQCGVRDISIIESAWVGDDTKRVYKVCGYDKLAEKYGINLHDLKDDKIRKVKCGNYIFEICEKALDTDFLINVPVLKAHCQTRMTCNLKNLKGCVSDREKRNFHTMGLHSPIAYLNKAIKTDFCVVDGICGDLTFEEGGNPVTRNMLICGENPVLLDSYCAGLLGLPPTQVDHIRIAAEIGVGELFNGENATITELNADNKPILIKFETGVAKRLSAFIDEDSACSACYSALVNAMYRADYRGKKVSVGQGFKGKSGVLGCGNCTKGFGQFVGGCPPTAMQIVEWLGQL